MKLASNPGISLELIRSNPRFTELSLNDSGRYPLGHNQYTTAHENDDLCYRRRNVIQTNPNPTWEFIVQHPEIAWERESLSEHPCITWKIVQDNPQIPWNYYSLTRNPTLILKLY